MAKCILDEQGWCARHKHKHTGSILDLSQRETEEGDTARMLWDMEPSLMDFTPFSQPTSPASSPSAGQKEPSWGLGNAIKKALDSVGITQDRAARWLGCSGCANRQEKLNRLGWWAARTLMGRGGKGELEEMMK